MRVGRAHAVTPQGRRRIATEDAYASTLRSSPSPMGWWRPGGRGGVPPRRVDTARARRRPARSDASRVRARCQRARLPTLPRRPEAAGMGTTMTAALFDDEDETVALGQRRRPRATSRGREPGAADRRPLARSGARAERRLTPGGGRDPPQRRVIHACPRHRCRRRVDTLTVQAQARRPLRPLLGRLRRWLRMRTSAVSSSRRSRAEGGGRGARRGRQPAGGGTTSRSSRLRSTTGTSSPTRRLSSRRSTTTQPPRRWSNRKPSGGTETGPGGRNAGAARDPARARAAIALVCGGESRSEPPQPRADHLVFAGLVAFAAFAATTIALTTTSSRPSWRGAGILAGLYFAAHWSCAARPYADPTCCRWRDC